MSYDMVFVSHTSRVKRPFYDPSTRYRSFALAEYFRRMGKRVAFMAQNTFESEAESFTNAPLIHFHRPKASETMLRYVLRNRKRQKLISDYDDLVFDVSAVRETPAVRDRGEDPSTVARNLAAYAEIGSMFDHCSVSTAPLAQQVSQVLGRSAVVVHNALDPFYSGIARVLARNKRTVKFDIGYFSGTASHNSDLAMVAPQIAAYLEEFQDRRMLLFGPVNVPPELQPFESRIEKRSVVSFYEMPMEIRSCRMVLGPLVDTVFARCKSGLKFFEAGVLGTSVAATPIPDIDRFDSPLLYKCKTPDDWAAALRAPTALGDQSKEAIWRILEDTKLERQIATWRNAFLES